MPAAAAPRRSEPTESPTCSTRSAPQPSAASAAANISGRGLYARQASLVTIRSKLQPRFASASCRSAVSMFDTMQSGRRAARRNSAAPGSGFGVDQ